MLKIIFFFLKHNKYLIKFNWLIYKFYTWFYTRRYGFLKSLLFNLSKMYYYLRKFKVFYWFFICIEFLAFEIYKFIYISFKKNKIGVKLLGKRKYRYIIRKEKKYKRLIITFLYLIYAPALFKDFLNALFYRYHRLFRRVEKRWRKERGKRFKKRPKILRYLPTYIGIKQLIPFLKYIYNSYLYLKHLFRKWRRIIFFLNKCYYIPSTFEAIKHNKFLILRIFFYLLFIYSFILFMRYLGFNDFIDHTFYNIIFILQGIIAHIKFIFSVFHSDIIFSKSSFFKNRIAEIKFIKVLFRRFYSMTVAGLVRSRNFYKIYSNRPLHKSWKRFDLIEIIEPMPWFSCVPQNKKYRKSEKWHSDSRRFEDYRMPWIIFKFIKKRYFIDSFDYLNKYTETEKYKFNKIWFWRYRIYRIRYIIKYLYLPLLKIFWWWLKRFSWMFWRAIVFFWKVITFIFLLPFRSAGFFLKLWLKIWIGFVSLFLKLISMTLKFFFKS